MQTMQQSAVKKITPVIMVEEIESCLPFWDRFGFTKTAEVPEGDRLGFVILAKDGVELMYQTHESVQKDAAGLVPKASGIGAGFFIEVTDIESIVHAVQGLEIVVPRRQTFYGMDEIGVREPGGHVVMFAQAIG